MNVNCWPRWPRTRGPIAPLTTWRSGSTLPRARQCRKPASACTRRSVGSCYMQRLRTGTHRMCSTWSTWSAVWSTWHLDLEFVAVDVLHARKGTPPRCLSFAGGRFVLVETNMLKILPPPGHYALPEGKPLTALRYKKNSYPLPGRRFLA